MKLFSEKVEPTFTDSNINILGVRNFKEIFVDVFEFEINGKKFIAEKVSDHKGMPVVNIPVVLKGGEYIAPFALRRGVIEILFNEDNATFIKPVLEEVHELIEQHSENEKEKIYSFIKNTVKESTNKLSADIENKTKYVEGLVNEKIINLTTNTIPNIFLKNMKGSDDSNLVDVKERLESIGTEINDVRAEKENIYNDLKALAEETSHLSDNVDKKINNTLSRMGNIKAELETSIESVVGDLKKKIEDVETNIESYYNEKITNISNEVYEITEQNKVNLIELIESSKQTLLEEISSIKNNVPNIVIEKANGKQEIDLKGVKTELEKIIGTKFSTEIAALRRLIEMSSGGGSVAKQFANGGTMDGNLTVSGVISASSYAGIPNPDLSLYLPISGGTINGNLTVTGTLSTTLLEALSANISIIDIKQYELSGFNVTGNATVQGSVSASDRIYSNTGVNAPQIRLQTGAFYGQINAPAATQNISVNLPNSSGTIATNNTAVMLVGAQAVSGAKTFSGQVELTNQQAVSSTSALTRQLGDQRYGTISDILTTALPVTSANFVTVASLTLPIGMYQIDAFIASSHAPSVGCKIRFGVNKDIKVGLTDNYGRPASPAFSWPIIDGNYNNTNVYAIRSDTGSVEFRRTITGIIEVDDINTVVSIDYAQSASTPLSASICRARAYILARKIN